MAKLSFQKVDHRCRSPLNQKEDLMRPVIEGWVGVLKKLKNKAKGNERFSPPNPNHRPRQFLFLNKRGAPSVIDFLNYFPRKEWRWRWRWGICGRAIRTHSHAGLEGCDLLSLLLIEPAAMLRMFPLKDLLQTGLLCGELLLELLHRFFHGLQRIMRLMNKGDGLSQLTIRR